VLTESTVSAGHGEKKSKRRTIALACLLCHSTVKAAAKAAGISEATMGRWLKDSEFARDYERARDNVLKLATEELRMGTLAAVAVLREVMSSKKAPAASRVSAARSFLEATSLLKGVSVTVNNQIPTDRDELNTVLVAALRDWIFESTEARQVLRALIEEAERGNGEQAKPVLQ
jgi:hypothetical protein